MTKNKTTVRPFSDHVLVYTKQPTTKNTKPGDVVLYKKEIWINDGHIVASIPSKNVDEEVLKENTMDNYIMINGKKIELTEEQLKTLGIEIEKKKNNSIEKKRNNPFARSEKYCTILKGNTVAFNIVDNYGCEEDNLYEDINYFNDVGFAQQLAWHQLLNRKLLKYAYDHEAEDCEWDDDKNTHYYICFDSKNCNFKVDLNVQIRSQNIYFSKKKVAEQAIEDVIKPFMKEHPKFVW